MYVGSVSTRTENETTEQPFIKAPHCAVCVYGQWEDRRHRRAPIVAATGPDDLSSWPVVDDAFISSCGEGRFVTARLCGDHVDLQGLPRLVSFETATLLAKLEEGNVGHLKEDGTLVYAADKEGLAKLQGNRVKATMTDGAIDPTVARPQPQNSDQELTIWRRP